MRLASRVLECVDAVAPASDKGVPTDTHKSHTLIKNIANSLKCIYVKKIIGRKRNER